jgi:adenylate cyclase
MRLHLFSIATPLTLTLCGLLFYAATARAETPVVKTAAHGVAQTVARTMPNLRLLLQQRLDHPEQAAAIDAVIQGSFAETHAVMVLDSSGFSRFTRELGIIAALATIHQMQMSVIPVIEAQGGSLIKLEADNVYAIFPDAAAAVSAAQAMKQQLALIDRRISIGIGYGELMMIDNGNGDRDLYGSEMNLAAKLGEDIAEVDEILLTPAAYRQLGDRTAASGADWNNTNWEITEAQISGMTIEIYRLIDQ